MTINAIPDEVFYDPSSWIGLAPDYDWSKLIVEPPAPGPIVVTPLPVTFDDQAMTITVPEMEGVTYWTGDLPIEAGIYSADAGATWEVTASANEGYQLSGTTSWSHDFPATPEAGVYQTTYTEPY